MKCSEYLWKYIDLQNRLTGESPERIQGELRLAMGNEPIVSDTTGETMTEQEARSVLGRNEKELREAHKENKQSLFEGIVCQQLGSDDAYHAAKAEGAEG